MVEYALSPIILLFNYLIHFLDCMFLENGKYPRHFLTSLDKQCNTVKYVY